MPNTMYMKRNMNIFLATGVPFGIFMAILYTALYGLQAGLMSGLTSGLVFGSLMFIIMGLLHSRAVKKIAGMQTEETMGIYHERLISLHVPCDRAFDLCAATMDLIIKCSIQEVNRPQGRIIAKAGINWKTWGDTITFDIHSMSDKDTEVKVSSRPTSWTTLVDFGKNLQNVETIISFLRTNSNNGHKPDCSISVPASFPDHN